MSVILPFYQFDTSSPPPGGGGGGSFPNYLAWEFEGDLTDTSNTYTFSGTGTYDTGIIGQAVYLNSYLFNAPNAFRIDWNTPWAFSFWVYVSFTSSRAFDLFFYGGLYTNLSYRFQISGGITRLFIYDSANSSEYIDFTTMGFSDFTTNNTWNLIVIRYNPLNSKQINIVANNSVSETQTFTKDFKVPADYNSQQCLRMAPSFSDMDVDQLTFWYGSVLTDQNIADLYNNGSGMALP